MLSHIEQSGTLAVFTGRSKKLICVFWKVNCCAPFVWLQLPSPFWVQPAAEAAAAKAAS